LERERISTRKRAYERPDVDRHREDRERNAGHDAYLRPLLSAAILDMDQGKKIDALELNRLSMRRLELIHAKLVYTKGALTKLQSMKKVPAPAATSPLTHFDAMRDAVIAKEPMSQAKELLLQRLMPKLVELSQKIRLTHYYDGDSEDPILQSGRLQSKQRRMLRTGSKSVPNKSSALDDDLGNIDHVFFFGEYQEDNEHPAPFRNTRFGGRADESDAILNQKERLDGTERRVSFPLNSIPMAGVHGYTRDINSLPNRDVVHNVFTSANPRDQRNEHQYNEATLGGAFLLLDLLRLRFKASQFPSSLNTDEKRLKKLESMSLAQLHEFMFRRYPDFKGGDEMNPQILVPGSVPFTTPGVRFDSPAPPTQ
jgi:hypothetical protein